MDAVDRDIELVKEYLTLIQKEYKRIAISLMLDAHGNKELIQDHLGALQDDYRRRAEPLIEALVTLENFRPRTLIMDLDQWKAITLSDTI